MNDERIAYLLSSFLAGTLTSEESNELEAWCSESDANQQLRLRLQDLSRLERDYWRRKAVDSERPLDDMQQRIAVLSAPQRRPARRWLLAVAAIAVGIICLGGLYWWRNASLEPAAQPAVAVADSLQGIHPGQTKALLTLPNGQMIALGSNTTANEQAVSKEMKRAKGSEQATPTMLCLDVPRGGEFKVTLEDGTEVWLNSASRLTYPEHFSATERRVEVEGEAYFKVQPNAEKPFLVETSGQLLRVYGTQFNIRSYAEEANVLTTLVEGSVALSKLSGHGGELVLTPGHQSMFRKSSEDLTVGVVDTEIVTSWRKGKFVFENQPLETIMRDLSRWYNFSYIFADESLRNIVFMGSIPRYADFNTALTIIEKSGGIKIKTQGKNVRIERE